MKKVVSLILALILLLGISPLTASAAGEPAFRFELSVDGSDTKEVRTGDVITVVLHLKRTDSTGAFTMYAMQDEIRYDSNFFELVEGSAVLSKDILSTDIGMRDNYREFYMNYLSTTGGARWEADTLIGSFQLRVIATSGVTKITNEDYLVSTKDGTGSYACEANELTIILSTECTIRFESNGGSAIPDQTVQYGEKIQAPEAPEREGYTFDGWYQDIDLTESWDFDQDTVKGNMTLYAKWKEGQAILPVEDPQDGADFPWLGLIAGVMLILLLLLFLTGKRVSFNSMGGSEVKSQWTRKNGKIKTPAEPIRSGKVFCGWYRDPECTESWNFENDTVSDKMSLYAKWSDTV